MKTRVHIYVSGRVQGVMYRARAEEKALALGVTGWVRNLPDGRVEAILEGAASRVEEMLRWCRQGPRDAVVEDVEVLQEPYTGEYLTFSVRY